MPKPLAATPPRVPYRKLFLTRWAALIWAAGIVWTAMDVAGGSPSVLPDNAAAVAANTSTGDVDTDRGIVLFNSVMSAK